MASPQTHHDSRCGHKATEQKDVDMRIPSWRRDGRDQEHLKRDTFQGPFTAYAEATAPRTSNTLFFDDHEFTFMEPPASQSQSQKCDETFTEPSASNFTSFSVDDPQASTGILQLNVPPRSMTMSSMALTEYTDPSSLTPSAKAAHSAMRRMLQRDLGQEGLLGVSTNGLQSLGEVSEEELEDWVVDDMESDVGMEGEGLLWRMNGDPEMGNGVEWRSRVKNIKALNFNDVQGSVKVALTVVGVLVIGGGVVALLWVLP
ncbi:hypothetical protein BDV96DRAFT_597761 [Lophiotrema nucula]|uniref:Uncharacterized protein n=1 Tax=Lophiotrema nucula TaxID=690887 RepID=A0A6A5ZHM4_9PLEO|nr:hypothetical protein BDV96DRAFT_597761 [Lophiotrema nucula]